MSTSDGSVIGATKIVDNGPDTARYTLVLVAEGYQNSELAQFHQDCQDLVDHMFTTPPLDELDLRCAFNVYRIDVASTDSGADDPTTCGGGGVSRATYFDATFCGDGVIERLLTVDSGSVINVVDAHVTHHDRIVVIVNSTTYGGSGGAVAVTSKGGNWLGVAMHEMGHAVFGLADEYDYWQGCGTGEAGHDHYTGPEFAQANISATSDRATIKWASLVAAATPMPTTTNANCSDCDTQGVPAGVTAETIGAWEGAGYNHCGAWRPTFRCMMRDLSAFCGVCRARIRTVLAPYAQPTTVTLATPTIAFNDVPEGTTTVRAARFAVSSCVDMTFRIVSGPTVTSGPPATSFGTPLGTVFNSPGNPPVRDAFAWISYTGTAPGDSATGTVTVRCEETGIDYVIPITANTVQRPKVVVELVLDRSGSMDWDAGDGRRRVDVLHNSALPFADLLPDDDAVGIVSFDQDGHDVMPVTVAGPPVFGAGRVAAKAAISAHTPNPAGSTAIGDGVELAHNRLAPVTGYDARAMIVLTDGQETDSKYIADVIGLINDRVFAIGLGTASEIDPVALSALTNGTGGYLLMTGTLDANDYYRLSKYYLQILASVTNNDIVLDPDGWLAAGQRHVIPFVLNEADIEANTILLTPAPWAVRFTLEAPDGQVIDPAVASGLPGGLFATAQNDAYYRVALPAPLPGGVAPVGTWKAILELDNAGFKKYISSLNRDQLNAQRELREALAHGLRYNLNVHTFSNLRMSPSLSQSSNLPGATLTLRVLLSEYGVPVDGRATVIANLEWPDGTTASLPLPEVAPGVFERSLVGSLAGIYTFNVQAVGTTLRGAPFTRHQVLTGMLWEGGDHRPPRTVDNPRPCDQQLCALIACMLESAIGPEAQKRLESMGIQVDALRRCLKEFCAG